MEYTPGAALTSFGFNQLESSVYVELLKQSPATGYRLAQRVGRAPANIYQALKALVQKGAVLVESDGDEATSYIPIPPNQLFASLRSSFDQRAESALKTLDMVNCPPDRGILSQLQTASQVFERSRSMLGEARETVIFDMMPELYDVLRPDIDAARTRGVQVVGIAYRWSDAESAIPFKGEAEEAVARRWPGLGLILVTDASAQLVAQVSTDMTEVLNAVYSDSVFLSCIMHGLLAADIRLVQLRSDPNYAVQPSPAIDAMALLSAKPPGLRTLLA